jgi:hypothetical protein
VASRALDHWSKHHEPIGRLLRADLIEYGGSIGMAAEKASKVREYGDRLMGSKPVSPSAVVEKVVRFKREIAKYAALQKFSELLSSDPLNDQKWMEVAEHALIKPRDESPMLAAPQWPVMNGEALYGLAGDVVRAIEPLTEADPAALLAQTLAAFGNVIGRGPYWMHCATRHALNVFLGIVGPTSNGKGTGLDLVLDFYNGVDPKWSSNPNIYAGLASGEGFIQMVRDASYRRNKDGKTMIADPGVADKRLLVVQGEFAQVLEVLERQGNTLATKLRNAWDGKPLLNNSLAHPLSATGAHVSLIVHTTQDDLRDLMRRTMILNGFANRFLWVCSRRSKPMPFGRQVPKEKRDPLVARLRDAVNFARSVKADPKQPGRMWFDKATSNLWVSAYKTTLSRDGENAITGRAAPQVRRLAHIYALMDKSAYVREKHLLASLAAWRYFADSARFIFGGISKIDPEEEKLLGALREAGKQGIARTEISVTVFNGNKTAEEITKVLGSLQKQGRVRMQVEPASTKGGPRPVRWFAVGG